LAPRAHVSTTDGKRLQLTVYEFQDTPQLAGLESCIVRHQPKTVVLPAKSLSDCESPAAAPHRGPPRLCICALSG
jgi:hypothetical protein